MQRQISQYKIKKKIIEALKENSFTPLTDLGAKYGLSRTTVWEYIRFDKTIPIKQRKYLTVENDCEAVLELYQKSPCLLQECLAEFDYPIEIERLQRMRRLKGIFNWGMIKVYDEDITLKRLLSPKMKPINAYFLGVLFFNARLDINPLGKKVVFLFMPPEMEPFVRKLIWFIKKDTHITYITHNTFYDYQRKIIIESDAFYDLIDTMRQDGVRLARAIPRVIPKELKKYFLQGIFDVGGQLFKLKYFKRGQKMKRVCFKIQGNSQLAWEHFQNLKLLFERELKGILPHTKRTMRIGEQQNFLYLWWEYIPSAQIIYNYVYENKEETIFSNTILHEQLQNIFANPPKIMKGEQKFESNQEE